MARYKTGIVIITKLVEHICRVINSYDSALRAAIAAGATAGNITSTQALALNTWLDALSSICGIWKALSGY